MCTDYPQLQHSDFCSQVFLFPGLEEGFLLPACGSVYGWEGGKDEEGSSVGAQDQGELLLSPHLH